MTERSDARARARARVGRRTGARHRRRRRRDGGSPRGPDTATSELYAHPVGVPDKHFHTGVHCRHDGTTRAYIAVFPQVTEGTYHLLHDDGSVRATVTITGGSVTQVDLGVADRSTDAQLTHTDH